MTKLRNLRVVSNARELRNNMTKEERVLWYGFLRTYPIKFTRQEVIGHYIADFYCPTVKLVIEIDGTSHSSEDAQKYDSARTEFLENHGIEVIRFYNGSIKLNFELVCLKIDEKVKQLLNEKR